MRTLNVGRSVLALGLFMTISGCGSSGVSLDRMAFEQSHNIGYFVHRVYPYHFWSGGTGTIGMWTDMGTELVTGQSQEVEQRMWQSGVYNVFEKRFASAFAEKLGSRFHPLDRSNLRYSDRKGKKVDIVGSAEAQGFDLVVEVSVRPVIYGARRDNVTRYESVVEVDLSATRISDRKTVWKTSVHSSSEVTSYPGYRTLDKLAEGAAEQLVSFLEAH
jgi:hypothetical protein